MSTWSHENIANFVCEENATEWLISKIAEANEKRVEREREAEKIFQTEVWQICVGRSLFGKIK